MFLGYFASFLNKNKKASLLSVLLDALFYLSFIPLLLFFQKLLISVISSVPIAGMQTLLANPEGSNLLLKILLKVLLAMISSLLLILFLVLLDIAIFKSIIWSVMLQKKISARMILRFLGLIALLLFLFIVPAFFSLGPVIATREAYLSTGVLSITVYHFFPFFIVMLFLVYFAASCFFHLVTGEKIFASFRNGIKQGLFSLHKFIWGFFLIAFFLWILERLVTGMGSLIGEKSLVLLYFILGLLVIVGLSLYNRIAIVQSFGYQDLPRAK